MLANHPKFWVQVSRRYPYGHTPKKQCTNYKHKTLYIHFFHSSGTTIGPKEKKRRHEKCIARATALLFTYIHGNPEDIVVNINLFWRFYSRLIIMLFVLLVEALPDCQYESQGSLVDVVVASYRCRRELLVRLCYTHSRVVLGFDVLGVHHGHLPLGTSSTCLGLWLHLLAGFAGLVVDLVVACQCWRNLYIETDWCVHEPFRRGHISAFRCQWIAYMAAKHQWMDHHPYAFQEHAGYVRIFLSSKYLGFAHVH